jgi:hypothetical protein
VGQNLRLCHWELSMGYGYTAERFSNARQLLTPPHPEGEHIAVVSALRESRLGLHRMNRSKLDDGVRTLIFQLERYMDTTGFQDVGDESALTIRAKGMSATEKADIARLVDDLAKWFVLNDD